MVGYANADQSGCGSWLVARGCGCGCGSGFGRGSAASGQGERADGRTDRRVPSISNGFSRIAIQGTTTPSEEKKSPYEVYTTVPGGNNG